MADNRLFRPGSPQIRNSGILRPATPTFTVPGIKLKVNDLKLKTVGGGDLPPIILPRLGPFDGLYVNDLMLVQNFMGPKTEVNSEDGSTDNTLLGHSVAMNGFGDHIALGNGNGTTVGNPAVSVLRYEHVLTNLSAQNTSEGAKFYDTVSSRYISNSGSGSLYYNASAGAIQFDGVDDFVDTGITFNSNVRIEFVYRYVGGDTAAANSGDPIHPSGNYPFLGSDGPSDPIISKNVLFSYGLKKNPAGVEYYQICYGNREGESGCDFIRTGIGASSQTSLDPRDYSKFYKLTLDGGVFTLSEEDGSNAEIISNRASANTNDVQLPFVNDCTLIIGASNSTEGAQRFTNVEVKSIKATQTNRPFPSYRLSSNKYLSSTQYELVTAVQPRILNQYQGFGDEEGTITFSEDGRTFAVASMGDDSLGSNYGAVYVYGMADFGEFENYRQKGQIIYGNPENHGANAFQTIKLTPDGKQLFIGNRADNTDGSQRGSVSAFRYISGSSSFWDAENVINCPGTTIQSFGLRFDINYNGTKLAIGDQMDDDKGTNTGKVYYYTSASGTGFELVSTLHTNNFGKLTQLSQFGSSQQNKYGGNGIAFSRNGHRLAIGIEEIDLTDAYYADDRIHDVGAYDVYDTSGRLPTKLMTLSADRTLFVPGFSSTSNFPAGTDPFYEARKNRFFGPCRFTNDGEIFLGSAPEGETIDLSNVSPYEGNQNGMVQIFALSAINLQQSLSTGFVSVTAPPPYDDKLQQQPKDFTVNFHGNLFTNQGFINGQYQTLNGSVVDSGVLSGAYKFAFDSMFGEPVFENTKYGKSLDIDNNFSNYIVGLPGFQSINDGQFAVYPENNIRGMIQTFKRSTEPQYYYNERHVSNGFQNNIDNLYMNISFNKMSVTRIKASSNQLGPEGIVFPPVQEKGDNDDPYVVKFELTEEGEGSVMQTALFGTQNTDPGVYTSYRSNGTAAQTDRFRDRLHGIVEFTYYVPEDNPIVGKYWHIGTSFASSVGGPFSYSPKGKKIIGGRWVTETLFYGSKFGGVDKPMSISRFLAPFEFEIAKNDGSDPRTTLIGSKGDKFFISEYKILDRDERLNNY